MISDSTQETKHKIDFQYPQGVYFLEKYDWMSKSGFSQKCTDQTGPEERPYENNFLIFSNTILNVSNS